MITVGMYYEVIKGKESEFEEMFESVANALNGSPGHTQSLLYRQVKKYNSYTILSEWDSEEAFKTFIQSDEFKNVTDWGKTEILQGRPRHKVYGREGNVG